MSRWIRIGLNFVACIVILAIAAGGFRFLLGLRPEPEKREVRETVYNVQVFDAKASNLQEIVTAFGTVRADREVVVPAQVAGEVTELHENLRVGLRVAGVPESGQDGEVLAKIDPRQYTERRDRVRNQVKELDADIERVRKERDNNGKLLEKARADLTAIQEQYDRVKRSRSRGGASPTEVTRALLEVRQYEQSVLQLETEADLVPIRLNSSRTKQDSMKADLKLAELDLENTVVTAPFAGAVSEVMVEKGQYVRVGDPLIRLTNTRLVEIPLPLALTDFLKIESQLQSGEQPEVELAINQTAAPQWRGKVVRAAPEADAGTRTVMVFVEVLNPESDGPRSESEPLPLRPGTFVHARIAGPRLSDAIVVPRDSVRKGRVFVEKDGVAESRDVELGTTLQSLVVVAQGLEAGDSVVMTNLDVIRSGVKLSVSDRIDLIQELAKQRTSSARVLPASTGE